MAKTTKAPAANEIDRKALLAALRTAEPALSAQNLLPLLRQFWFTGAAVRATDGTIGVEAPITTSFHGGVPGKVLVGFVESVDAANIKITSATENEVVLSAGHSRIRLPLEPVNNCPWPFPTPNAEAESVIQLSDTWLEALNHAMLSVTNNTTHDERRGVTFNLEKISVLKEVAPTGKIKKNSKPVEPELVEEMRLNLYSTDSKTISRASMPAPDEWVAENFVLPGDAISTMLKHMSSDAVLRMWDNHVETSNPAGVKVLTRLLDVPTPTDFRMAIQRHMPTTPLLPLPDGLKQALLRAELLRTDKDALPASFTFDGDSVVIEAKSELGELKEELVFDGEHEKMTVKFTPDVMLRGLDKRDQFVTSKRAMILTGPDHLTYLVACYAG